MKLKEISYKIPMFNFWTNQFERNADVKGYAIQIKELPNLHFCVRHDGYGWVGDHYETGLSVGIFENSRFMAVKAVVEKVRSTNENGLLAKAFKKNGFKPNI